MAKPKREEVVPANGTTGGDAYDAEVTRLRKKHDWEGAARCSREVERRIARLIRAGTATEDEKRLRLQALQDLQTDYTVLERSKERMQAALEYHRAIIQLSTRDRLDDHYSYTWVGDAYAANDLPEQAREMFLCAGASVIAAWQAEWLCVALDDLTALERDTGNESAATVIADLAKGFRRAAGKVQRRVRSTSQKKEDMGQTDAEAPSPEQEK